LTEKGGYLDLRF